MPVSATAMWSSKAPLSSGAVPCALSTTLPRSVNLTELLSRLSRIWRSRLTSPISVSGRCGVDAARRSPGPSRRRVSGSARRRASTHSRRLNGAVSSSMRPASIFEKSRMSLMIVSSASLLVRMIVASSRCSASRSLRSSRPLMPMTAFIGVRISWLMAARKVLFAAFAASAAARASRAEWYRRALSSAIEASCAKRCRRSTSESPNGRSSELSRATPSVPTVSVPDSSGTPTSARMRPAGSRPCGPPRSRSSRPRVASPDCHTRPATPSPSDMRAPSSSSKTPVATRFSSSSPSGLRM